MSSNLKKTLLLIDDENDVLESMQIILELDGKKTITASSGEIGIQMYTEHNPSLVFLDLNMPRMNGFEVFSKLIAYDKDAKVIFFTGSQIDEAKLKQAKQNGLLDLVIKPLSLNELNKVIDKYI